MRIPASETASFTYGDYCQWPDDERWELIDGEAFAMAPAPTRLHQKFVVELAAQIHPRLSGTGCRVYVDPFDVQLPKASESDDRINTVVQPDLAVICDPGKLDDRGCRGAPDWIIEIISPASALHDQRRKRALYERVGVREYWLVHPLDRVLSIDRLDARGLYDKPVVQALEGETAVGVLEGLLIQWPIAQTPAPDPARMPHRDGAHERR